MKSVKEKLKEVRKAGFDNFSDIPIDYWEPKLPNESQQQYESRRVKEGIMLSKYLSQHTLSTLPSRKKAHTTSTESLT